MSNIDTINVGGLDYDIEDATARQQATSAITVAAYVENGNTASRAYPTVGTPVNWKGSLYYTKATIAQGSTLAAGTNLAAAVNIGKMLSNIKTYVGSDSKLHFTDATGADSVLPFKSSIVPTYYTRGSGAHSSWSYTLPAGKFLFIAACGSSWYATHTATGGTELTKYVVGDGNDGGYVGVSVRYVESTGSTRVSCSVGNSGEYIVGIIIKLD